MAFGKGNEDWWLFFIIALILAGGILQLSFTAHQEDTRIRTDQLVKTRFMERSIHAGQVGNLTGTSSDLYSADYLDLKWQLAQMRSADPNIRFAYLIGKRPDGMLIFLVDSEAPGSEGYSPPGEEYPEASAELGAMFSFPEEFTGGPYTDRWGTWLSSLVPLVDPVTGEVVAIYGIDTDAGDWIIRIVIACIPIVVGVLVLVLLVLFFVNVRRRDRHEREILEASEKALRESESRLFDIIDFLPDPTFAIDREGKVISWNRAMEEMTGVSSSEMLGKGDYEYSLPFYGERRPILIDLINEPDEVIAKKYTNIVREKGFLIADTSLPRPRGRPMWLMGKAGPLFNRQGEIVGAIEAIRDLTSRKEAEEALRKSEERFRILLQNVNDGLIVYDVSAAGPGKIREANDRACQMLGYTLEELIGLTIRDISVPEHAARIPQITGEMAAMKRAIFETEFLRKDGTRVSAEISTRLFDLENREVALAAMRDITERKRVEEEKTRHTAELKQYADALSRTNSKLNLMNSITRHDILNQITAVTGYLDLMNTTVTDPGLRGFIQPALLASENIENYIRFSKEYQEIGVRSPGWFPIRNLIVSSTAGLPLDPVRLVIDIRNLEIFADPLLEKVFYTFIENALRHGKGMTQIRFSSQKSGTSLVIVCEDDGPGVPPQFKEKIFDRGYYLHTGYGLFLSREILAITGITIRETGEFGRGARFEIIVPEGEYRFNDRS
ncbi:MAG TPA: PAS domain S-box protein [Methanoregulaceae archaeon]|nr:PAS domain S-box protein [Methanoregulaceae archaeon]